MAGHQVEKIMLRGNDHVFFNHLICQKIQQFIIQDEALAITKAAALADIIVLALSTIMMRRTVGCKPCLTRQFFVCSYFFPMVYLRTTAVAAADILEKVQCSLQERSAWWIHCR